MTEASWQFRVIETLNIGNPGWGFARGAFCLPSGLGVRIQAIQREEFGSPICTGDGPPVKTYSLQPLPNTYGLLSR